MRMSMSLAPMLTLSHACPECGTILNKAENQATDKEIIEARQNMSSANDPVHDLPKKQCSKCGNWYYPKQKKRGKRT